MLTLKALKPQTLKALTDQRTNPNGEVIYPLLLTR